MSGIMTDDTLRAALADAREYVEEAATRYYDGTGGDAARRRAGALLTRINYELSAPAASAAEVVKRTPLPPGSFIEYMGEEAEVVRDDGGDHLTVTIDSREQQWFWEFEGEACKVVSLAVPAAPQPAIIAPAAPADPNGWRVEPPPSDEHPLAAKHRLLHEAKHGPLSDVASAAMGFALKLEEYRAAFNRDREKPVTDDDVEAALNAVLGAARKYAEWVQPAAPVAEARADGMPASSDERQLRRMLCASHSPQAYMDDGEASDCTASPFIDFMRDSVSTISEKLRARAVVRLAAAPAAAGSAEPAQQATQEAGPVAWAWKDKTSGAQGCYFDDPALCGADASPRYEWTKLYAAPQAPAAPATSIEAVNEALDKLGGMSIPDDPMERLGWLHDFALVLGGKVPIRARANGATLTDSAYLEAK